MRNYTTIEQSEKLLELGLNSDTADMYYFCDPTPAGNVMHPTLIVVEEHLHSRLPEYDKGDIPCWSLEALLEVMPEIDNQLPSLRKYKNYYCVVYSDNVTRLGDNQWQNGKTPTEAAYNMVCWLLESGYLK